jgi:hypothetical protein
MAHEDNIPEPTEDMEHFVHMHIDYGQMEPDEDGEERRFGMVHMHVHGVDTSAFVETLLMLAISTTATAMQGPGENVPGPLKGLPAEAREAVADMLARQWLSQKIIHTASRGHMVMDMAVPDDASSLFEE